MSRVLEEAEVPESNRLEGFLHPRANPALLGHEAAEAAFLAAWASGRLPHAWLIAGSRGIGKATLAYRAARFVLAEDAGQGGALFGEAAAPTTLAVAADNPVFRRAAAGGHGGLVTLRREWDFDKKRHFTAIRVGDVRKLAPYFGQTPAEGRWRVVVVDSIDDMNENAANALLKILEEPPAHSLFLLVSHQPGRLLPTIVSRCRRLALQELPDATVEALLAELQPDLGADERRALAGLGEGSPGRALSLAGAGGLGLYRELVATFDALSRGREEAAFKLAARATGKDAETQFNLLVDLMDGWFGRMIRAAASNGTVPDIVPGEAAVAGRFLAVADHGRWLDRWTEDAAFLARGDRLSLDRRNAILNILLGISATLRPA
ncbi:DNA polymerase III subunit delta' [Oceanibacterium hippocampi]|uniref:DNA polymerase III subunit tau n=1 Tax=Oceanibacterium hippocampi TaxID=745714 RepID=A0A1Y5T8P0_9PROT|nr:DNA polymerase III subunit delta' [Oceanibacterium hippocampi]SLN54816.1 DNA polymerase III subunit tau [Oceanibacterium hippocampi]